MLQSLLIGFSNQVYKTVAQLRGYEESGVIDIDSVSLDTRKNLKDLGAL